MKNDGVDKECFQLKKKIINVKPSICWNENFLYDPSTITQLINMEKLINKR